MANPEWSNDEGPSDFCAEQARWNRWHKGIPEAPRPALRLADVWRQEDILENASQDLMGDRDDVRD